MTSINLFTKCPYSADTKTRMKGFLSNEERIFLSKEMLVNILREMDKVTSAVNKNIWVYPNYGSYNLGKIINGYNFIKKTQVGRNLEERMDHCLKSEVADNNKIIIFGSDIPSLDHEIIEDAIESLSNNEVVIGPSVDGGYYLLGTTLYQKGIFNSKTNDLNFLISYSIKNKFRYKLLRELKDIDNPKDLLSI